MLVPRSFSSFKMAVWCHVPESLVIWVPNTDSYTVNRIGQVSSGHYNTQLQTQFVLLSSFHFSLWSRLKNLSHSRSKNCRLFPLCFHSVYAVSVTEHNLKTWNLNGNPGGSPGGASWRESRRESRRIFWRESRRES